MGLVELTVQEIINAYVPHLTEFIESCFMILMPSWLNLPCKAHQCCSAPHEGDYDGDDDHDTREDAIVQKWKKPGPQRRMNYLHQKEIIPSDLKGKLPASVPVDTICIFNQNGILPPLLKNVMLDWHYSPLISSRWNSEAISILSLNFYNNLKAHQTQARINIIAADEQVQVMAQIAAKKENYWKGDKIIACHHKNCSQDSDKWSAIYKIINELGAKGMSSNETDCPATSKPKSVKTYESALRIENILKQIGNSSLKHHWKAERKEVRSTPVLGLPCNWYNNS
ncbi:hypothetical protein HD554DRAFT_2038254 [Boletus coccyginus]|nr:hypothetical protein HD554DRAFT_2038254 [Boletus coccyginus]